MKKPKALTLKQTAEKLGVSRQWAYTLYRNGKLKACDVGGFLLFDPKSVEAYCRARESVTDSGEFTNGQNDIQKRKGRGRKAPG